MSASVTPSEETSARTETPEEDELELDTTVEDDSVSKREDVTEENEEDEGEEENEKRKRKETAEQKIEEKPLTKEMVAKNLSMLCKIGDGISHAYVNANLSQMSLTDISVMENYPHLRYLDVSKNWLKNISAVQKLNKLLSLNASHNLLPSATLAPMPYLQVANFSENKLETCEDIEHQRLEKLNMNNNYNIRSLSPLDCAVLKNLRELEVRGNAIHSLEDLNLPSLKKLYMAQNKITRLNGIGRMVTLTHLHLRDNQIKELDGFTEEMQHLEYINLRMNRIDQFSELKKLACLPALKTIVLSGNPIEEQDEEDMYRIEVLIILRRLDRLDKDDYDEDERLDAEEIDETRRQEEMEATRSSSSDSGLK